MGFLVGVRLGFLDTRILEYPAGGVNWCSGVPDQANVPEGETRVKLVVKMVVKMVGKFA